MRRYLQSDFAWWLAMMPAFGIAIYFVNGWLSNRDQPSMLLSAIGALATGVLICCWIFARNEAARPVEELTNETGLNEMNDLNAVESNELVISEMSGDVGIFEAEPEPEVHLVPPAKLEEAETSQSRWMKKGLDLARANRYRDALYCFTYVLQSDPTNHAALTAKGACLMKMNRPEEALKAFTQAAIIDETNALAQEGKEAMLRRVRSSTPPSRM